MSSAVSGITSRGSPRNSSTPLLRREDESDLASISERTSNEISDGNASTPGKQSETQLFKFGNKKKEEPKMEQFLPSTQAAIAAMRPVSPDTSASSDIRVSSAVSPTRSPTRAPIRSTSPHGSLLASSQIFERNVQESSIPPGLSPAIPSHIQTEDMIPPALEASSLAITDQRLDPDEVEIVTHAAHHTAAAGLAEGTSSAIHSDLTPQAALQDWQHESIYSALSRQQEPAEIDTASTYGALDPNDPRRLSFISFADVVQAEHAETPLAQGKTRSPPLDRSPSPVRSPASSHSQSLSQGITTPPLRSHSGSAKGLDLSPGRSPINSPQQHGELTIETMRQALRRSGSGDLGTGSAARSCGSLPVSASVGAEDGSDRIPFR